MRKTSCVQWQRSQKQCCNKTPVWILTHPDREGAGRTIPHSCAKAPSHKFVVDMSQMVTATDNNLTCTWHNRCLQSYEESTHEPSYDRGHGSLQHIPEFKQGPQLIFIWAMLKENGSLSLVRSDLVKRFFLFLVSSFTHSWVALQPFYVT